MVARDLELDDVEKTLRFDSGDWNSDQLVHYCLPGCECGGNEAASLSKAQEIARLSMGSGIAVPLLYRFKHMEHAAAFVMRGRAQQGISGCCVGVDV